MYKLMEKVRKRRGFTLVELLVVIVVLAVLAAIVLPKFMNSSQRSKESALRSDLKVVRNAISMFQADTGKYPNTLADLSETVVGSVKVAGGGAVTPADWHGPYLDSVPKDPISGNDFTYTAATGKVVSSSTDNTVDGSTTYDKLQQLWQSLASLPVWNYEKYDFVDKT